MRRAVLVLGAQRSGTSVVSHMLFELGVDFGSWERFIQFEHNPIFFELDWVVDYNEKILDALGYQYTDFFLCVEEDFKTPGIQQIEKELKNLIEQEWAEAPLIGIKDPRFSLTFPVWEKVLLDSGYQITVVLSFRSPAGFLGSNKKLFHNWEGWTDDRHLNFWLQLNLSAIYFARNYPTYSVNYDQLVADPLQVASFLASMCNLDLERAAYAAQVVQGSYYHHPGCSEVGHAFVDDCYQRLCSGTLTPADYLEYRRNFESSL